MPSWNSVTKFQGDLYFRIRPTATQMDNVKHDGFCWRAHSNTVKEKKKSFFEFLKNQSFETIAITLTQFAIAGLLFCTGWAQNTSL